MRLFDIHERAQRRSRVGAVHVSHSEKGRGRHQFRRRIWTSQISFQGQSDMVTMFLTHEKRRRARIKVTVERESTYCDIMSGLMESYGGAKACDTSSNDNDVKRHIT